MRLLTSSLCFLVASLCCSTATAELNLYDPLPAQTEQMDDVTFQSWAKEHNRDAYNFAYQASKAFQENVTIVTDSQFETTGYSGYYGFPISGMRRETTRAYSRNTWGGGPVLIVNPYVRDH